MTDQFGAFLIGIMLGYGIAFLVSVFLGCGGFRTPRH